MTGPIVSPEKTGRERLREWLGEQKQNQSWLARQLDVAPSAVSQVLTGARRPTLDMAAQIEKLTGIPASTFAEAS